ncbi:MAG: ribosome maturation factor RimP [Oscillospiraceae bacterium]
MSNEKKTGTAGLVTKLVQPIADENNVMLWDVRYEKEGTSWFLRVFIDKEDGVTIEDCENVSRALSKKLDELDPIEQSYYLEVSSPGIGRDLVQPWHFEQYIGFPVTVRLIRAVDGVREFTGEMTAFDGTNVTIIMEEIETEMTFALKEAAWVRLYEEINF